MNGNVLWYHFIHFDRPGYRNTNIFRRLFQLFAYVYRRLEIGATVIERYTGYSHVIRCDRLMAFDIENIRYLVRSVH